MYDESKFETPYACMITLCASLLGWFSNGEAWASLRSPLQRLMMHPAAATVYLPAQNAVADKFIQLISSSLNTRGELENLADVIQRYTMECMWKRSRIRILSDYVLSMTSQDKMYFLQHCTLYDMHVP